MKWEICLIRPFSCHSSNFLIMARCLRRLSRSDIRGALTFGTSFILPNPSHVFVFPMSFTVAAPILESVSKGVDVSCLLLRPKLNMSANPPPLLGSGVAGLFDSSFNSFSKSSKSFISTLVEPDRCLSFIKSSIPGPKLTDGDEF